MKYYWIFHIEEGEVRGVIGRHGRRENTGFWWQTLKEWNLLRVEERVDIGKILQFFLGNYVIRCQLTCCCAK
jgi:hypothetical protein